MSQWPKMLYRSGTALRIWDVHDVDMLIVHSPEEETRSIEQGWRLSPDALNHDANGRKGGRRKAK